jgi:2-polyprenyl-6-hydroxyphenyl methylase/3-demethylubiquinone-9 3-methyltransferase
MRLAGLESHAMTGMLYNPISKTYKLNAKDVDVNYLVHASKPTN